MSKIKSPFVQPTPFNCPSCDCKLRNEHEVSRELRTNQRFIKFQCDKCKQSTRIRQNPIVRGFEIVTS